MRLGTLLKVVVGIALATPVATVQTASAVSGAPGAVEFEVILRDDVPAGAAPSFTVVETDLDGLAHLYAAAGERQTIELNGSAHIAVTDPEASNQWSIAASNVGAAWAVETGNPDVTIAILDTGVAGDANLDHVRPGVSFVAGDPAVDPTGHGTWVAEIAAAAHDETGIAGMCPGCTILPVQVGDETGRVPWSAAAQGVTWAVDNGADIINLSFGGRVQSQVLTDAVNYAIANDVIVVAAAGNNGTPTEFFPAAIPGVLGVAGHDENHERYGWSNYGDWADVSAPGCTMGRSEGEWVPICGTSFASPTIAGALGLVVAQGAVTPGEAEALVEGATTAQDWVETGWVDVGAVVASAPGQFRDVDPGAYYAEGVAWLADTGATTGTSPTTFSPDQPVTRGQLATFLWRLDAATDQG